MAFLLVMIIGDRYLMLKYILYSPKDTVRGSIEATWCLCTRYEFLAKESGA
ncbi:MAG: hypothetical protein F6K17_33160 [Okeania sp. SIO3C4]|nr:hypothetical protein [Okeania sp. SIO3B3]NER07090.1 hypothetical protein [Okeania sp. SIO3C4]